MTPSKGLFPPLPWGPTATSSRVMPHFYLAPGSSLTSRWGPLAHQTSVSLGPIGQRLLPRPCLQAHLITPTPFLIPLRLSLLFQRPSVPVTLGLDVHQPRKTREIPCPAPQPLLRPLPLQPDGSSDLTSLQGSERSLLYTWSQGP